MPDAHAGDIDALLNQIESLADESGGPSMPAPGAVRFIVATDWTSAAPALTMLQAFRRLVGPGLPVQLAFAVPHEPTEADASCVHVLLEGLEAGEDLDGLELLSFKTAAASAYDSAVVPTGSAEELLTQVGGAILRLHDVVAQVTELIEAEEPVSDDPTLNVGDRTSLERRLAAFAP
ncbi:histidine kinase [Agilicoccus flavus]|uniref:histidine kinase n=1 Tax=Agilicoccus flavus TaxID=2775968 RepID=UPI001CF66549|nr:histidine kinase [Agilicoccus flavus]